MQPATFSTRIRATVAGWTFSSGRITGWTSRLKGATRKAWRMAWLGCGIMTNMEKATRWTRRRSMCSPPSPRPPRAIAANITVRNFIDYFGAFESSALRRVVAFAGEHLQVVIGSLDFNLAEFAVALAVGRVVAQRVLAAQLRRNLIERFHEPFLRACVEHPAARFFRKLLCGAGIRSIARIGNEDDVYHRVRALRGFDSLFNAYLASFILGVGHDDNGFAPGFAIEFFATGQIDRVIERRARDLPRPHRAWISTDRATARNIDAGPPNRPVELSVIISEIGEQVHIGVKRHHQRHISFAQNPAEKRTAGVLNGAEHELLASRSIQQKRQGDGQRHFL